MARRYSPLGYGAAIRLLPTAKPDRPPSRTARPSRARTRHKNAKDQLTKYQPVAVGVDKAYSQLESDHTGMLFRILTGTDAL
jgi:hypothetical protein